MDRAAFVTPVAAARLAVSRGTGFDRVGERPWLALIGLFAVALGILAWFDRDMTFFHDEWLFIRLRDLSIDGILRPHNEHFSATLVVLYRGLIGLFGLGSYWPFITVTLALHAVVAGLVYVAARREAPAAFALGAAAVMLLLGAGGYDILWAFQSATVGATAAGLAAVLIAPRRPWAAALLLTVAVVTSGVALAFVAGTVVHLALTRPRAIAWLALPVAIYVAWYLSFGAAAVAQARTPSLDGVPLYVAAGLLAAAAAAVGSQSVLVGGLVVATLAILVYLSRHASPLLVALFACDLAFLGLSGLVRAQDGAAGAEQSRYIYVLAPAFLVAGAALLSRARQPFGSRLGLALLAVSLVGNVTLMAATHDEILARVACEHDTGFALDPSQHTDC